MRLLSAAEQSNLVDLKERLEQVTTAVVQQVLNFIIARVVEETLVVQVYLVNLYRAALIAHHELLERQKASKKSLH